LPGAVIEEAARRHRLRCTSAVSKVLVHADRDAVGEDLELVPSLGADSRRRAELAALVALDVRLGLEAVPLAGAVGGEALSGGQRKAGEELHEAHDANHRQPPALNRPLLFWPPLG
jgi:hypothetical protein